VDEVAEELDCLADLRALRFRERSLASSLCCSRSSLVFAMVTEKGRRGRKVRIPHFTFGTLI
jgi:hypothetical protein